MNIGLMTAKHEKRLPEQDPAADPQYWGSCGRLFSRYNTGEQEASFPRAVFQGEVTGTAFSLLTT